MTHISDGTLRALHDDALSAEERARVRQHLTVCSRCADRASAIGERGERVHTLLSELEPQVERDPISPRLVRSRMAAYRQKRKERHMVRNPFSRRYRPAWAVAALAVLIVVTLTIPPVRTLAGELLGIFRVQEVTFTPVDVDALPDEEMLEALAPEIERMFGDTLAMVAEREAEELTEAEARERASFPIRLPDTAEAAHHEWTAPMHITMEIDLPRIEALFSELGYGDIDLPRELDGATATADFSGMLTTTYGDCQEASRGRDCTTFIQMASPTVSVPDGLDVERLGRIYLELLGTPADEAAHLSKQIDWTTTLVVPFPHHVNLTHETLSVDGVEVTLLHSESGYRPTAEYLLTWVEDDVIYAVAGKGDHAEALTFITSAR